MAHTRHGVDRSCTTLPAQGCHSCSLPLFCHPWRGHTLTRGVSATCGSRQSSQMSAGWLSVVSEQAYLGAPHLNPKCERSDWPNQLFPFPPVENHRIMAYISCTGVTQNDLKAQLKACAGAAQGLHMPKNAALADEDPCISIPALQNQPGHQNYVAWPKSHSSPAISITRQKFEGYSFFKIFFPFFPSTTLC